MVRVPRKGILPFFEAATKTPWFWWNAVPQQTWPFFGGKWLPSPTFWYLPGDSSRDQTWFPIVGLVTLKQPLIDFGSRDSTIPKYGHDRRIANLVIHREATLETFGGKTSFLSIHLPSGKLTWQWKIPILNRKYIFKWWIFHCHVRLPECNRIFSTTLRLTPCQFFCFWAPKSCSQKTKKKLDPSFWTKGPETRFVQRNKGRVTQLFLLKNFTQIPSNDHISQLGKFGKSLTRFLCTFFGGEMSVCRRVPT